MRWKAAIEKYVGAIECVESNIVTRLKSRLSTATTATEMFRVFSQFSLLFVRPDDVQFVTTESPESLHGISTEKDLISKVKDDVAITGHPR